MHNVQSFESAGHAHKCTHVRTWYIRGAIETDVRHVVSILMYSYMQTCASCVEVR